MVTPAKCRACNKRLVCISDLCGPCWRDYALMHVQMSRFGLEVSIQGYLAWSAARIAEATT